MLRIYVIFTLFLGTSVMQFLGLYFEADNLFTSIHYWSFPFLLLYILRNVNIKLTNNEKIFLLICIAFIFLSVIILKKSAGLGVIINNVLEPILLLCTLRQDYNKNVLFIRKCLLFFLFVECGIAWFEVINHSLVFAQHDNTSNYGMMWMMENEMRAYSLHGHPLQNAFLVSLLGICILLSKGQVILKYILFFICLITLFSFNTRSSIYLLSVLFLFILFSDFRNKILSFNQKILVFSLAVLAIFVLIYLIVYYDFGNRLFKYSLNDDSGKTRFMLVDILLNLDIIELLFGMENGGVLYLITKYNLYAIENSLVNIIIVNGSIFAVLWVVYIFLVLRDFSYRKKMFYFSFVVFFLLLNANNSLITSTPILPIYILSLYSLTCIDFNKTNTSLYQ